MTDLIRFTKMHGAGNDYIYVNTLLYPLANPEKLAIEWSAPHTGIGSDGLVLIGRSEVADFRMRIFNADGSEAMMCGNASRCIGKYVYEKGLTDKQDLTLETPAGIKKLALTVEKGHVNKITVGMGRPEIETKALTLEAGGVKYTGTTVSMGNPHFVVFVDDAGKIDLPTTGPLLESHPYFPDRTNVEFAQIITPSLIKMRVWERGSGVTMACGTGACATVVAAAATGRAARESLVKMDGGTLHICWDDTSGEVLMTGDAVTVFEGEIQLQS